jgi:hypothetical protein
MMNQSKKLTKLWIKKGADWLQNRRDFKSLRGAVLPKSKRNQFYFTHHNRMMV